MTSIPRVAGTEHNHKMAMSIQQQWEDQGLESAGVEEYDVLLSYPAVKPNPNKVRAILVVA